MISEYFIPEGFEPSPMRYEPERYHPVHVSAHCRNLDIALWAVKPDPMPEI